jgi:hypothetical protein
VVIDKITSDIDGNNDGKWTQDLERARKVDGRKVKIALHLRQKTTMTWNWIAYQLSMGTGASAANAVCAATQK